MFPPLLGSMGANASVASTPGDDESDEASLISHVDWVSNVGDELADCWETLPAPSPAAPSPAKDDKPVDVYCLP